MKTKSLILVVFLAVLSCTTENNLETKIFQKTEKVAGSKSGVFIISSYNYDAIGNPAAGIIGWETSVGAIDNSIAWTEKWLDADFPFDTIQAEAVQGESVVYPGKFVASPDIKGRVDAPNYLYEYLAHFVRMVWFKGLHNNPMDVWVVNGIVEYIDRVNIEEIKGKKDYLEESKMKMLLGQYEEKQWNDYSIVSNPFYNPDRVNIFFTYEKPRYGLQLLSRKILNKSGNGPEIIQNSIREILKRSISGEIVNPRIFFDVIESQSGQDLEWFWEDYFRKPVPPIGSKTYKIIEDFNNEVVGI